MRHYTYEEYRERQARRRAWLLGLIAAGLFVGALAVFFAPSADAATINVSPGQSIQNAINSAAVGDTVLVAAGDYTGGVTISKAITLQGQPGAKIHAATPGQGVGVTIAADGCTVAGLYIDSFAMAIAPSGLSPRSKVTVKNNHTYYSQFHLWINGADWLVEGNDFEKVRWWDGKGDADYTRMFGTGHVFRGNYLYGTNFSNTDLAPAAGSDYAHTDGIQYYGNNGDVLKACIIENNWFTDFHQGLFLCDEFAGSLAVLTIRNNMFWGQTYTPAPGSSNFKGIPSWAICIGKNVGGTGMVVENNLIYNVANFYGIRAASSGVWRKNIVVGKGGAGTVYDPSTSTPANVTVGNLLYGYAWLGQGGFAGSDTTANPMLANAASPLGVDGVPFTSDDGARPLAPVAAGFGPLLWTTAPPAPANRAPVATPDTASAAYQSPGIDVMVLANDSDPDGDVLTVLSATVVTAGMLPGEIGTVSVTVGSKSLRYVAPVTNTKAFIQTINYTISDGKGGTATSNVQVSVAGPPPAPVKPKMVWELVRIYNTNGTLKGTRWAPVTETSVKPVTVP